MPDFLHIYNHQADQYEQMVACEDYQGNILLALQQIRPLNGLDVVEFGAGTGRVSNLILPLARSMLVCDGSAAMLAVASTKLKPSGFSLVLAVADNPNLPAASQCADLVIAGWSFGHIPSWYPQSWREELGRVVGEMKRLLRPGGTAVIIETLGTGQTTPQPPTERLAGYYRVLEEEYGFASTWIRTDYQFQSLVEAESLLTFFFGPEMIGRVDPQSFILPECTGLWWLHT